MVCAFVCVCVCVCVRVCACGGSGRAHGSRDSADSQAMPTEGGACVSYWLVD